jgi:hypothetical protein
MGNDHLSRTASFKSHMFDRTAEKYVIISIQSLCSILIRHSMKCNKSWNEVISSRLRQKKKKRQGNN